MAQLKKLFLWYLLLNKRFLKKSGLLVILIIIPMLSFALNIVALEDSGIITIALATENKNDPQNQKVISEITKDSRFIKFLLSETSSDAENLVREGKCDAAWILPDNLTQKLSDFVSKKQSVVRILEREETIPLMLAREKLNGALFKTCASSLYIKFSREKVTELSGFSDAELMEYYNKISSNGDLFEFYYTNEAHSAKYATETSYLVTPVRGLMAIMLVLSGLAAAMFYSADDKKGTFAWVSQKKKPFVAGVFHLIPVSLTAVALLISLYFLGLWVGFFREILIVFLYLICIIVFCMIVRLLCVSSKMLAAVTPIMMLSFIVVCPVFLDIKIFRPIGLFLPTYHYLSAVHNNKFIGFMIIYALVGTAVYFLISKILRKA